MAKVSGKNKIVTNRAVRTKKVPGLWGFEGSAAGAPVRPDRILGKSYEKTERAARKRKVPWFNPSGRSKRDLGQRFAE